MLLTWLLTRLLTRLLTDLGVDAEVLPGGQGQGQEVVGLSGLFAVELNQLPQLLHHLLDQKTLSSIHCDRTRSLTDLLY